MKKTRLEIRSVFSNKMFLNRKFIFFSSTVQYSTVQYITVSYNVRTFPFLNRERDTERHRETTESTVP